MYYQYLSVVFTRTEGADYEKLIFLAKLIFEGLSRMEIKIVYIGWWIPLFVKCFGEGSFPYQCFARKKQNKLTRLSFIFSRTNSVRGTIPGARTILGNLKQLGMKVVPCPANGCKLSRLKHLHSNKVHSLAIWLHYARSIETYCSNTLNLSSVSFTNKQTKSSKEWRYYWWLDNSYWGPQETEG